MSTMSGREDGELRMKNDRSVEDHSGEMEKCKEQKSRGVRLGRNAIAVMVLGLLLVSGSLHAQQMTAAAKIDAGDTAWMLISTALVMLMTPGLALFYGGMVRRKNVLGIRCNG
ncbi:MAG: hypothetical protein NTV54_06000 [Ignavibacteriales bacterium]|nr:hypothetical protein [Ignavibacteriales bacterium]